MGNLFFDEPGVRAPRSLRVGDTVLVSNGNTQDRITRNHFLKRTGEVVRVTSETYGIYVRFPFNVEIDGVLPLHGFGYGPMTYIFEPSELEVVDG